jgi:hypothetical protein
MEAAQGIRSRSWTKSTKIDAAPLAPLRWPVARRAAEWAGAGIRVPQACPGHGGGHADRASRAGHHGQDRSAAHTTLGGEFPALALSIRGVGASFHHGPRFRRPPCDPGRWDFPSPVLALASRQSPSHTGRSSSADSHTPRHDMVCFHGHSMVPRPYNVRLLLELSSAQSPFARARCDLARHDVTHHVRRHYPTFIAPTGSCASPPPSSCLGRTLNTRSVQVAVSPCWEKDLPAVVSAPLSLRAWPPTPAARVVHLPVSSHTTAAFPPFGPGRRSTMSVQRFQYGTFFEAAVIR